MRKRKNSSAEQMRYKKHFQYYLIAVAVFFAILNMTGVYDNRGEESVMNMISQEERECFCYSYYLKSDRNRVEKFTCDHSEISKKIHEIFLQKVPCEPVEFGYKWIALLLLPAAYGLQKLVEYHHKIEKRRKQYKYDK